MENKKLKLDELRVQSFVTHFKKEEGKTLEIQGGALSLTCVYSKGWICPVKTIEETECI